jgi:hypothetical protein
METGSHCHERREFDLCREDVKEMRKAETQEQLQRQSAALGEDCASLQSTMLAETGTKQKFERLSSETIWQKPKCELQRVYKHSLTRANTDVFDVGSMKFRFMFQHKLLLRCQRLENTTKKIRHAFIEKMSLFRIFENPTKKSVVLSTPESLFQVIFNI